MWVRWWILLIPPFAVSFILVAASQYVFLKASFYEDLGLGRVGDQLVLENYIRFVTDGFYLKVLWVTVKTSGLAAISTLILGFPVAYLIARMCSSWSMVLLAGIVVSTFITIKIDVVLYCTKIGYILTSPSRLVPSGLERTGTTA